jgi:tetratricopeptide (TPR) repeat protein
MLFKRRKQRSSVPQCVKGVQYYRQGNYRCAAEALEVYTRRKDLLGQTASHYYTMSCRALGVQAMGREAFTEAEQWLRRALEEMRTSYSSRPGGDSGNRLALAQWRAGRGDQAMITLIDDLRRSGSSPARYRQLALLAAGDNDFVEAARWLEQAIQADCSDWRSWRYKGLVATVKGHLPEAIHAFQRAAALQPGNLELLWQLSRTVAAARDGGLRITLPLPEATMPVEETPLRHLANYVTFEPDYLEACLHLPMDAEPERYYTMLQSVVGMALVIHPDYADLYYHQSRICQRLDQLDDAIDLARKAVERNPNYRQAWLHLAKLCMQIGRKDEAIHALRRTVTSGGDWPDVHHLLGELYRSRHRKNAARQCYQRALMLNPHYQPAAEGLEKVAA